MDPGFDILSIFLAVSDIDRHILHHGFIYLIENIADDAPLQKLRLFQCLQHQVRFVEPAHIQSE